SGRQGRPRPAGRTATPRAGASNAAHGDRPRAWRDIVDLGLLYDIAVDDGGNVAIAMTLTTPGCPLGGFLDDQIRICLTALPQVREVRVELVWEPPWEPQAMSDVAKEQL